MNKKACDRCKGDYEKENEYTPKYIIVRGSVMSFVIPQKLDLCEDCSKDLKKFIDDYKK